MYYQRGEGVRQDYAEAVKYYHKSAEQDNSYAQNNLGFLYKCAQGVARDYDQAIQWYKKAAAQMNIIVQKIRIICRKE